MRQPRLTGRQPPASQTIWPDAWGLNTRTSGAGREAVLANQGTDPRRLQLDRIQRIDACNLDVEFRLGIAVEQRHRTLRRRVPFAIGISAETADAAQLGLHRLGEISGRRAGAERGNVHRFLGLGLLGRRRAGRGPVRGRVTGSSYDLGTLVGGWRFVRDPLPLGLGRLLLRYLL